MKGVILDADSLGPDDVDLGPILGLPIEWTVHGTCPPELVAERIAKVEIVLTNKAPVGKAEFAANPNLRYIGVLATGTNVIDFAAAGAHNVVISNVVGYGAASVVQHTWALILALTTRLPDYNVAALDGRWAESPYFCVLDYPVMELAGKVLGIVGYGELGQGVANIGRAFGMKVKVAALPWRHGSNTNQCDQLDRTSFDTLIAEADVISLHCPLTEETRHLVGRRELAKMKNTALLINCARGGLVDEQALVEALEDGVIGGAGVDVLTEEPPKNGNPLLNPDIPNLIVTPHSAWVAKESRQRLIGQAAENVQAFLAGEPRNVVGN
ncbi:MAG: D-2-hydroxyacid dehydrogenase [Porticoccus sp.]|nr:D-2-hydroxyacid dehydrogenase [Porticoccus sp.]